MLNGNHPLRFQPVDFLPKRAPSPGMSSAATRMRILVPTGLSQTDVPALMLGVRMAVAQPHVVTVLHVVSAENPPPPSGGLDALHLLHQAADQIHRGVAGFDQPCSIEQGRRKIAEFLESAVPGPLLRQLDVRAEIGVGDVAETVARFAEEQSADAVIMTSRHKRRWWPMRPARARQVLKLTRRQVVVVRGGSGRNNGTTRGRKKSIW